MSRSLFFKGLHEGAIGTVFKVDTKKTKEGKEFKSINISISEKPGKDKDYVTTWSGFVMYGGPLSEEQLLKKRVVLQGIYVTTSQQDKDGTKVTYTNYTVNNLIPLGEVAKKATTEKTEAKPAEAEAADDLVSDDDLPFY